MPQVVECGDCGKKLRADDELAGLKVRCPRCKAVVNVPVVVIGAPPTLDVWESDDPPVTELPPRVSTTPERRKKRSKRRSQDAAGWPPFSRWWTLIAGGLLIIVAFFVPAIGLYLVLAVGGFSALALAGILAALVLPTVVEHPLLFLQLALFGVGVGRYTREQRERGAARFRTVWPAISHAALALGCSVFALLAAGSSPFMEKNSPFAFKERHRRPAIEKPVLPVAAAAEVDLPEAEVALPAIPVHPVAALPIRPAPSIASESVVPAPQIGTAQPLAAPQITFDLAPRFPTSQMPATNPARQAMERAQNRAQEVHEKMVQRRRGIRRRAHPDGRSQDSATPPPSNPQPSPGAPPGGL
jgi:hypothetical protein